MKNLKENLEKLLKASIEGKITWTKQNPTTYNWKQRTSDGSHINTIIQKYKSKENSDLSFRLWDLDDKYTIMEISHSGSKDEIKQLLEKIYELASGSNLFMGDVFSDILREF